MEEKITLCGDNCLECPRYQAHSEEELSAVAQLWYRVGWRDEIVCAEEMRCRGCDSHKKCTYHLVECIQDRHVEKCAQCISFPCETIEDMLRKSAKSQQICKTVCSEAEYQMLNRAFFQKEVNLKK